MELLAGIIFSGLLENEQKIVNSRFILGGFIHDHLLQVLKKTIAGI